MLFSEILERSSRSAFEAISAEHQRFVRGPHKARYLTNKPLLVAFAAIEEGGDASVAEPGLRVRVNATGWTQRITGKLNSDIETKVDAALWEWRALSQANFLHFFNLISVDVHVHTLVDLTEKPQAARHDRVSSTEALSKLFSSRLSELASTRKARSEYFANQQQDIWDRFRDQIMKGEAVELGHSERNQLDDLIFPGPDLIALPLPLLGVPLVTCYFTPSAQAYNKPHDILEDLFGRRFRILRDIVMPYFISLIHSLALTKLHETIDEDASEVVRSFLKDTSRLLLCPGLRIAGDDVSLGKNWLGTYQDTEVLSVPLPDEWLRGAEAEFELITYKTFDGLQKIESSALGGMRLHRTVLVELLSQLALFVFDGARHKRKKTRLVKTSTLLINLRDHLESSLEEIVETLPLEPRTELQNLAIQLLEESRCPVAARDTYVRCVRENEDPDRRSQEGISKVEEMPLEWKRHLVSDLEGRLDATIDRGNYLLQEVANALADGHWLWGEERVSTSGAEKRDLEAFVYHLLDTRVKQDGSMSLLGWALEHGDVEAPEVIIERRHREAISLTVNNAECVTKLEFYLALLLLGGWSPKQRSAEPQAASLNFKHTEGVTTIEVHSTPPDEKRKEKRKGRLRDVSEIMLKARDRNQGRLSTEKFSHSLLLLDKFVGLQKSDSQVGPGYMMLSWRK